MVTAVNLFPEFPRFSLGGHPNEDELARACSQEFYDDNPWSDYASKLFFKGGNIANWKWKSGDPAARKNQLECFNGLLGSFGIGHKEKEAVAGWMLSEMLSEVPEYLPQEKKD